MKKKLYNYSKNNENKNFSRTSREKSSSELSVAGFFNLSELRTLFK